MDATIYHNPACGASRNTLALIRAGGIEPTVIEYLQNPPRRDRLATVVAEASLTVCEAITRDALPYLTDRYAERKEDAAELEKRVSLKSI